MTALSESLQRGLGALVAFVYPPRCISCGADVESDFGLCGACWRDTPFLATPSCAGCGAELTGGAEDGDLCDACLRTPRPWDRGYAALGYDARSRALVMGLKHYDKTEIARSASRWMARLVPDTPPEALCLPVPLHWRRRIARRYNQSALLAEEIARKLGCDWAPDMLLRRHPTPPLKSISHDARHALLDGAIEATPKAGAITGRPVLLIDDVMTSGATLAAATEAIRPLKPARIDVLVLARATGRP